MAATTAEDVADLTLRYVYTRDPGRDRWTRLDAALGPLQGDCEDWAYTMLWRLAGRSWPRFWGLVLTRRAELWWTKFHGTGEPHVMLWVEGYGWTDSVHRDWSEGPQHPKIKRYSAGLLAATLLIK